MIICESARFEPTGESTRPNFPVTLTQHINGEWRGPISDKTFPEIDPTTEEEIAQVAEDTLEDVEAAIQAANTVFKTGTWSQLSERDRGEILSTSKGYFVEPTVFADMNSEMTIAHEESFGPILSIIPFDDFEDAIRIANSNYTDLYRVCLLTT